MSFITLKNEKIFYILHNSANSKTNSTIVLIHGAGANHLSMLDLLNYFKKKYGKRFNILVLDLPGHFRSAGIALEQKITDGNLNARYNYNKHNYTQFYDIKRYAVIVKELIIELNLNTNKQIILVGHSMGVPIALTYSSLFPDDIARVLLIAGCDNLYVRDSFIASLESNFDKTIKLFLKDAYSSSKNLEYALMDVYRTPPAVTINDFKAVKYFNPKKEIEFNKINNSNIYFHIVYSEKDRIVNEKCILDLSQKLKYVKLKKISANSHVEILINNIQLEDEVDKFLLT